MIRSMSDSSLSDSDDSSVYVTPPHSDSDSSVGVPVGANSVADATDGSQTDSEDNNSYDSESDGSQSVSTRSSSSYQTDVTASSLSSVDDEGREDNESNMSSDDSQLSAEEEDEDTPDYFNSDSADSDDAGVFMAAAILGPAAAAAAIMHNPRNLLAQLRRDNAELPVEENVPLENNVPQPQAFEEVIDLEQAAAPAEPQPGPSNDSNSKTARKRPASEMEEDEDEGQMCPICFDSWKGVGEHRLVSLKCGHLFGKSCVEKWVRSNKKCPKCNTANKMADIRLIYAPVIKVKEAAEEERLQAALQEALNDKREMEMKMLRQAQEIKSLKEAQEAQKKASSSSRPERNNDRRAQGQNNRYSFKIVKENSLQNGGGRVMAYCPWNTQIAVSRSSAMAGFGIRFFNCEREFLVQNLDSFHALPIRDVEYCPNRTNSILLTASLDKTAKMIDYRTNSIVQTYRSQNAAWSCCWDTTGHDEEVCKISVGLNNGEVARYDIRMPSTDPYMILGKKTMVPTQDGTAVASLVSIPPGFSRSLPRGALIACHIRSCQLFVGDEDVFGVKLPFEGTFSSLRSEPVSGHLLLTTKKATHTVIRTLKEDNVEPLNLFEPVLEIDGGNKAQSMLNRSAITTFQKGNDAKLVVAANEETSKTVRLWSVSDGGSKVGELRVADNVMDICSLSFNQKKYFAFLSDKKVVFHETQLR